MVSSNSSTRAPVYASIRRTPAATELSDMIFTIPIFPVAATCVPPQNSIEEPNWITRTLSPYFSPKRAIAPSSLASSIGILRYSFKGILARILALTICSTLRSSSSVTFWKWEKSKRNESGVTNEPFCSICSPRTSRRAASSKWVAEWLAAQAARLSVSTQAIIGASGCSGNFLVICIGRLFSFLVSTTSIVSNSLTNTPVSPT